MTDPTPQAPPTEGEIRAATGAIVRLKEQRQSAGSSSRDKARAALTAAFAHPEGTVARLQSELAELAPSWAKLLTAEIDERKAAEAALAAAKAETLKWQEDWNFANNQMLAAVVEKEDAEAALAESRGELEMAEDRLKSCFAWAKAARDKKLGCRHRGRCDGLTKWAIG